MGVRKGEHKLRAPRNEEHRLRRAQDINKIYSESHDMPCQLIPGNHYPVRLEMNGFPLNTARIAEWAKNQHSRKNITLLFNQSRLTKRS